MILGTKNMRRQSSFSIGRDHRPNIRILYLSRYLLTRKRQPSIASAMNLYCTAAPRRTSVTTGVNVTSSGWLASRKITTLGRIPDESDETRNIQA